jgi:hypothetical protein
MPHAEPVTPDGLNSRDLAQAIVRRVAPRDLERTHLTFGQYAILHYARQHMTQREAKVAAELATLGDNGDLPSRQELWEMALSILRRRTASEAAEK